MMGFSKWCLIMLHKPMSAVCYIARWLPKGTKILKFPNLSKTKIFYLASPFPPYSPYPSCGNFKFQENKIWSCLSPEKVDFPALETLLTRNV